MNFLIFKLVLEKAEEPEIKLPTSDGSFIGKDSDAGRDWEQEEKGTTEDEIAGWHHQLDGHEFEQIPGVGDAWRHENTCSTMGIP